MTAAYAASNPLNFNSAAYRPVAGRLLLFPAKQTHEVEPNETDEARISVSYDLVVTSRGGPGDGHHEFLMPSLSVWRRVGRPEAAPAPARSGPSPARDWIPLAEVSGHRRAADAITLPARDGHVLWEPTVLPHCSSPAAWGEYAAELAAVPDEDWLRDHSGAVLLWNGCREWRGFRDAVDRLTVHLRGRDVSLDGAGLTAPVLQRRDAGGEPPFRRGRTHLCVYLRLDHAGAPPDPEAGPACAIDFAEGGAVALEPGDMLLVGGCRRHRLRGASTVIQFGLDLPAIARAEALGSRALQEPEVLDAVAFAAAAAQPVGHALPPPQVLFEKMQWLEARARRRIRHETCPVVRRFLIDHADPASATPEELALVRGHGLPAEAGDVRDGVVIEDVPVLSAAECETLCRFAAAHVTSVVPDTVDDLPEYQVNLTIDGLSALIGAERVAVLTRIPDALRPSDGPAPRDAYRHIDIFLRMYSPQTRPYIAFHSDTCAYTVNVALNEDESFSGGRLLALGEAGLVAPSRRTGAALLHAGNLVHGVSRIERGTRYSLILFFHEAKAA